MEYTNGFNYQEDKVDIIYFDFCNKAFDKVIHRSVMPKLSQCGIGEIILNE